MEGGGEESPEKEGDESDEGESCAALSVDSWDGERWWGWGYITSMDSPSKVKPSRKPSRSFVSPGEKRSAAGGSGGGGELKRVGSKEKWKSVMVSERRIVGG